MLRATLRRGQGADDHVDSVAIRGIHVAPEPEGAAQLHGDEAVGECRQEPGGFESMVRADEPGGHPEQWSDGPSVGLRRWPLIGRQVAEDEAVGPWMRVREDPELVGHSAQPGTRLRIGPTRLEVSAK